MCVIRGAEGDVGFVVTSGDDVNLSDERVDAKAVSVAFESVEGVSLFCPLGSFIVMRLIRLF